MLAAVAGLVTSCVLIVGSGAAQATESDDPVTSTSPAADDTPVAGTNDDDPAVDETKAGTDDDATAPAPQAVPVELEGRRGHLVAPNFDPDGIPAARQAAATLSWLWVATRSETVRFETHGSEMDTVLMVTESGADTPIAVGDDDGDVHTSSVILNVTAGTSYQVEVEPKDAQQGLVNLGWYPVTSSTPARDADDLAEPNSELSVSASFPEIPISVNTGKSRSRRHGSATAPGMPSLPPWTRHPKVPGSGNSATTRTGDPYFTCPTRPTYAPTPSRTGT